MVWGLRAASLFLPSLGLKYLDIERLSVESLDVKSFAVKMCAMPECDHDHIDRLIERLEPLSHVDIDLDVEGIVDRIASINKRIKRWDGRDPRAVRPDASRLSGAGDAPALAQRPSQLARVSWQPTWSSSGAMTSRLDRLEEAGYVRRLARSRRSPRASSSSLTQEGERAWDEAASGQGRRARRSSPRR